MNRKRFAKLKRRPDHSSLVKAGEEAKKLLIKKGFQLPDSQSALDRIRKYKKAPMLPGMPQYLPRVWTLNGTRRILIDIAREWETKTDRSDQENITEFFKMAVRIMNEEESKLKKKMAQSVKDKEYDTALIFQKDTIKGVRSLLVDSFALSIIVKSNADVSTYIEWFFEWTDALLKQWGENPAKKK